MGITEGVGVTDKNTGEEVAEDEGVVDGVLEGEGVLEGVSEGEGVTEGVAVEERVGSMHGAQYPLPTGGIEHQVGKGHRNLL